MDRISSWNIGGLNWPTKQEELKIFLHQNKIGLIGHQETKVKEEKASRIAQNIFPGWHWIHNFQISQGRIWVAWNPSMYHVSAICMSDQHIHSRVIQQHSGKIFYITYVYVNSYDALRRVLWDALISLLASMDDAWCVLGDFNSVLYPQDRRGGTDI